MPISINYIVVLIATVVSVAMGFLWYGPLFGKQWRALSGMKSEDMTPEMKKGMWKRYLLMIVGSLIMALVLARNVVFSSVYLHISGVSAGLETGFWNWIGFIAPVTLGSVLWEKKSWKLWVINNGYYLAALLIMGMIVSIW